MSKPILCLDFDGVLHSYSSGWKGADVIPDPINPGAAEFLDRAVGSFQVAIYSSRSSQPNGILAMQLWLRLSLYREMEEARADEVLAMIGWPEAKPPAFLSIDYRAVTFTGQWPSMDEMLAFQPWFKKRPLETARDREVQDFLSASGGEAKP